MEYKVKFEPIDVTKIETIVENEDGEKHYKYIKDIEQIYMSDKMKLEEMLRKFKTTLR